MKTEVTNGLVCYRTTRSLSKGKGNNPYLMAGNILNANRAGIFYDLRYERAHKKTEA